VVTRFTSTKTSLNKRMPQSPLALKLWISTLDCS
jgi:hypothetical protein